MGRSETVGVEASTASGGLTVIAVTNAIVRSLSARENSRLDRGAAKQQERD